ncbi:MAG: T9SS type A sorting domain-containing protein [Bacteroidia bacterium]|nr:T9SS type A sorting domain-containing protein [Bacteroidia bacterium]
MNLKIVYLSLFLLNVWSSIGQVSRRNAKSINAYHTNYQRINASSVSYHAFEIKQGALWAWGFNSFGQLGDSTTFQKYKPIQISADNNWAMASAGYWHSLAIKTNGTLWSWGKNDYGQLGNGNYANKIIPTLVGLDSNWVSVSAGEFYNFGIKANGTLWAWGLNINLKFGFGGPANANIPIQVGLDSNWVNVATNSVGCIGLKANGTLWDMFGSPNSGNPTQIGINTDWKTIAAGYGSFYALKSNGTLWAWGFNESGQLGVGDKATKQIPTQVGNANNWVNMAAGRFHCLALKSNGTLWGWGSNNSYQLATLADTTFITPTQVSPLNNWVSIAAGFEHSMAVNVNGIFFSWGCNGYGQVGNEDFLNQAEPVKISAENVWLNVFGGRNNSFGVKTNGSLWGWGQNGFGQLGLLNPTETLKPLLANIDSNWVAAALGGSHSLGLKANGTIWSTGFNAYGNLGNNTFLNANQFNQVGNDSNWVNIAVGEHHNLAIKSNGTLWAWGNNSYGEVGDGSSAIKSTPVQVGTDNNWAAISAGNIHSLGLKTNGTLWAWGSNFFGQLGDSVINNQNTPYRIGGDTTWIGIYAGDFYTLALKSNGTLWAWGRNISGQLGIGDSFNRYFPVKVGNTKNWIQIKAGNSTSMGLNVNGNLWFWGANKNGEFADSSKGSWVPIENHFEKNYVSIEAGAFYSMVLNSTRNKFCAAGLNNFGQLGNWNNTNQFAFGCNKECNLPPRPTVFSNNTSICRGNKANLVASGLGNLRWYTDTLSDSIIAFGNNFSTPFLNNNSTFYVKDSTCDLGASTAISVSVILTPTIGFAHNGLQQCFTNHEFIIIDTSNVNQQNFIRTWQLNNQDTALGDTAIFKFKTANQYQIKLKIIGNLPNTCADSITIPLQVYNTPKISLSASKDTICQGNEVLLNATGPGNIRFLNNIINNTKFKPDSTNIYTAITLDSNSCSDTATKKITVNPTPKISASSSANEICKNTSVILNATGANNYLWTDSIRNNVPFVPAITKTYQVIGLNLFNCADSALVTVQVKPLPNAQIVVNKTQITAVATNTNYQWINCETNKTPIFNETNQVFVANKNGNYAVIVNQNGCSDTSICVLINSVSVNEMVDGNDVNIYPNPNNGNFTIAFLKEGNYQIVNQLGQVIRSFEVKNNLTNKLTISELPHGVYFINSQNQYQFKPHKIVVTN